MSTVIKPINSVSMNVANYFGTVLSYSVIAIPIFRGDYDSLEDADLSSFISKVNLLYLFVFSRSFECLMYLYGM